VYLEKNTKIQALSVSGLVTQLFLFLTDFRVTIATTATIDTSINQNRQSMVNSKEYKRVSPVAVFNIRQTSGKPKYSFSGILMKSGLFSTNPELKLARTPTKAIKIRSRQSNLTISPWIKFQAIMS